MAKKLLLKIFSIVMAAILIVFGTSIGVIYFINQDSAEKSLISRTEMLADLISDGDYMRLALVEDFGDYRVTVCDEYGDVLFESHAQDLESHKDREEIIAALAGESRVVTRHSDTLGYDMYYYAATSGGVVLRLAIKKSTVTGFVLSVLPFVIGAIAVALLISALFAYRFAKRSVKPVLEIRDSLKSINEGDYKPLTASRSDPELYSVFTETDELFKKLDAKLKDSRIAEKQRSDFFANASHELKTPLTSIQGMTELVLSKEPEGSQNHKYLVRINKEAVRLNSLIMDMLGLSSLETQPPAVFEPVELRRIADEAAEELSELAKSKNIAVTVSGEAEIKADPEKIYKLVSNLLSNALRYNKQNGRVFIAISEDNQKVTLSVEDTGIGIADKHLGRLGERFYRVDKSRSKNTGGTGLGLSIVKHICALYGAQFKIYSKIGEGTKAEAVFKKAH